MSRRILDETTKSVFASDDYLYMDSATDGATKITPDNLVRNTTVAQQLAQHIADAADDLESVQGDIEDIQTDLSDLRSDLGDLSELDTTDKSSIVGAINEVAEGGSGSGLTADIKQALLDCFENVAWIDDDGQTYYDALEDALYPPADLVSISAVYTQSGTVYDTDTLDSLKTDLVVTANMSDSTTQTVTTYTLSGTLAEGTSTITVAYGGKTTTFNVTVTSSSVTNPYVSDNMTLWLDGIYNTGINHDASATTWTNLINNTTYTNTGVTVSADGMVFDGTAGHGFLGTKPSSPTTIEVVIDVTTTSTTQVLINGFGSNDNGNVTVKSNALLQRKGSSNGGSHALSTGLHTHTFVIGTAQYVDGVEVSGGATTVSWAIVSENMAIGNALNDQGSLNSTSAAYPFSGTIKCIRFYSDALTAEEVASNFSVDATRFGIS